MTNKITIKKDLESIFEEYGLNDYKWIDPKKIIVSQWVRMKCMFGCGDFGRASCPPNMPSVEDCKTFFHEYTNAVIFKFNNDSNDLSVQKKWTKQCNSRLLKVEKDVFFSGYQKTFMTLMSTCSLCKECGKGKLQCKNPSLARPTPEALAVDVFSTVRNYDFPIRVLKDYSEKLNRYAFLLID